MEEARNINGVIMHNSVGNARKIRKKHSPLAGFS